MSTMPSEADKYMVYNIVMPVAWAKIAEYKWSYVSEAIDFVIICSICT